MMRDTSTPLVAGLAAVGAAAAIGVGIVYATSGDQVPAAGDTAVLAGDSSLDEALRSTLEVTLQESGETPADSALDRLAENLGITRDQLDDALQQTALDMVDDALADGLIDEERAAALRERIESGEPFGLFGHGFGHFFGAGERGIAIGGAAMAEKIQDLADEGVIDQAAADAIIAALDQADGPISLNDLVDDGIISQDTLDAIRDAMPFRGPGHHFHGGPFFAPFGGAQGGEDDGSDDSSADGESGFEA
jgi:hypothetical protein